MTCWSAGCLETGPGRRLRLLNLFCVMFGAVHNRRPDVETSLYEPVKRFLEQLGYAVKGEVGHCDMVGLRDDDAVVVICELKMAFNLELILQGVDRATAGDEIWLAAQLSSRGKGRESDPRYRNLCWRLGFGLLGVSSSGRVDILVSPVAGRLENPAPECLWLVREIGTRRLCLDRNREERAGIMGPGLARMR